MLQRYWPFNSYQYWCLSSPCNMNTISTRQVKALFWNRTKLQENVEKLEGRFTNHTFELPPFCLRKWKSKWFLVSLVWQLLTEIHLKFTICDNWRFCEHFCKPFLCCCVDFSPSEILCFSLVYWYIILCTIIWNVVIQQHRLNIEIIFWAW